MSATPNPARPSNASPWSRGDATVEQIEANVIRYCTPWQRLFQLTNGLRRQPSEFNDRRDEVVEARIKHSQKDGRFPKSPVA